MIWPRSTGDQRPTIQAKARVRTEAILVRISLARDLGQRKLVVSKNIGNPKLRRHLDGIRFVETSDESDADVRGVRGERGEFVRVFCECFVGVKELGAGARGQGCRNLVGVSRVDGRCDLVVYDIEEFVERLDDGLEFAESWRHGCCWMGRRVVGTRLLNSIADGGSQRTQEWGRVKIGRVRRTAEGGEEAVGAEDWGRVTGTQDLVGNGKGERPFFRWRDAKHRPSATLPSSLFGTRKASAHVRSRTCARLGFCAVRRKRIWLSPLGDTRARAGGPISRRRGRGRVESNPRNKRRVCILDLE